MTDELIITPDIKIYEMITKYPALENKLIELAPVFVKLKNPFLRNTVAKVTTLRQAAVVGGISLSTLVSTLRKEINQDTAEIGENGNLEIKGKPEWVISFAKKEEYDAIADIDEGIHPIGRVMEATASLSNNEYYLLITSFVPKPLIDALANKGYESFSENIDDIRFGTYIRKL